MDFKTCVDKPEPDEAVAIEIASVQFCIFSSMKFRQLHGWLNAQLYMLTDLLIFVGWTNDQPCLIRKLIGLNSKHSREFKISYDSLNRE